MTSETTTDSDPGDTDHPSDTPQRRTGAAPGFRLALTGLLAVLLVAGIAVVVFVTLTRTSSAEGNLAERVVDAAQGRNEIQEERERVMEVASQFMLRVNTYGPDLLDEDGRMPEYRDLVSELITATFRADFEQQVGTAEQTVAQAGLGRSSEVYAVGVSTLDADSATALVAGQFTNSFPQGQVDRGQVDQGQGDQGGDDQGGDEERVDGAPAQFRVRVELVRVEGEWLVDAFAPVTGEGAGPTDPTAPVEPSAPSGSSDGGEQP